MSKIKLAAVVGPTAGGKTDLAIGISKLFDGEVVSCDSMQIYDFAPVATASPTKEDMSQVPHHMVGILRAGESFSVSKYAEMAHGIIKNIHERGKLPVLTGGTGLYYSAVVDNIKFLESGFDEKIRKELENRFDEKGAQSLYDELYAIDNAAAEKININDRKRIIRGLEIYYSTGMTPTQQILHSKEQPSPYDLCAIGITFRDRQKLYDRINRRVDIMLENGLLEEAEYIIKNKINGTGMQAIGVKELRPYFEGRITLETAVETVKRESRRYAKRQLTWFGRDRRIHWIYADEICRQDVLENARNIVEKFVNL